MISKLFRKKSDRRRKLRLTIGVKLISIISLTIVMALSTMIILASYFFRTDNEKRIIENNLDISRIIALKVKTDFSSILKMANYTASTLINKKVSDDIAKDFFSKEKDVIFIGIATRKNGAVSVENSMLNDAFLTTNKLNAGQVMNSITMKNSIFVKSFNTEQIVENVSLLLNVPSIGIVVPYIKTSSISASHILIVYVSMNRFLEAVKSAGIVKTFIVNNEGYLIAHHDSSLVQANVNLKNIDIVVLMNKNKVDNGQTRYQDEKGVWHLGSFKKIGFAGVGVISTAEEDKAFAAVKQIQKRNILITIIVLNLAILIVYFFSKTLTGPIKKLVDATKEIEAGNFHVKIDHMPADEIGMLMRSFNEMGIGLSEREKIKDAFGKFVNKEIAERVLKGDIKLGGERKEAAVFFSDIRPFTAISEQLEPEEVVEFLNKYMTRMVNCVNATKGVVDKFIGDAVMAIWGAPVSTGNDTENAIRGALLMRKSLAEFNEERKAMGKVEIKIGCGINTGPVLAGQIGSQDKMEYTVIGDTVNLASRIESLNKPFGTDILISENSYKLVKDFFAVEQMQPIKVKGKAAPLHIYAVLGSIEDPDRPKSLAELQKQLEIDVSKLDTFDPNDKEVKFEILSDKNNKKQK